MSTRDQHQYQERLVRRLVDLNEGRIDARTRRQAGYLLADAYSVSQLARRHDVGGSATRSPDVPTLHDARFASVLDWAQSIHGLDFDDSHNDTMMHCAGPVIGPALGLASSLNVTLDRMLMAIAAGYEASLMPFRVGLAVSRGTLPTIGYGALGTVASVLVMHSASEDQLRTGLSLVAGSLGGPHSRQVMEGQPDQKSHQLALTVASGLTAAGAALSGAKFHTEWLAGRYGLVPDPVVDESALVRPAVDEISVKLYPSVRYSHGPLLVAERIRGKLRDDQIGAVEIHTPASDVQGRRIYEHSGRRRDSADVTWSSYSIPWLVSVMLTQGPEFVLRHAVPEGRAEAVADLAARIRVHDDGQGTGDGLTPVTIRVLDHAGDLLLEETLATLGDDVDSLNRSVAWHRKIGYCVGNRYTVTAGREWLEPFLDRLEQSGDRPAAGFLSL